jgi:hypothetical protein
MPDNIFNKVVNNRRVGYLRSYLTHFFDNLEPNFLFIRGDGNPKFSIQDVGQLYMIEAPFLIIGILAMLLSYPSIAIFLLLWLTLAIVPAATARETPHALRILNSLPTWQIFVAFGITATVSRIRYQVLRIQFKHIVTVALVVLYSFSIVYYLHNYYRHYPYEYSGEWQYGYREAIQKIFTIEQNYNKIVVSDTIGRPYMYTLFYTRTDPNAYFATVDASFDTAGFYHVYGFGKYRFGGALPSVLESGTLYIWDATSVPKGARVIDTIYLLSGDAKLAIFDNGSTKP